MTVRISVAMATYNGEKFIHEQLESLRNQQFLPCELVVCDDGSSDSTLEILQAFSETAPFPVFIHKNKINLGYSDNFLKAANLCTGDWVSFCDQDDIWLPNKILDTHSAIEKDSRPLMILQNSYICSSDLSHQERLFPNLLHHGFHPPRSQFGFWVWPGFLQTFNKSMLRHLRQEVRPKNYHPGLGAISHDKWTCLIANATGGIAVLSAPAALYRRHDKSATGSYAVQSIMERVSKSLPVSSSHYSFLSEVAKESADYLLRLAESDNISETADFRLSAAEFNRIARTHDLRALLYSPCVFCLRILYFLKIALTGGYLGPKMVALGWKSATKDLLRSLSLLAPIQGAINRCNTKT